MLFSTFTTSKGPTALVSANLLYIALDILLVAIALLLFIPGLVLFIECIAALFVGRPSSRQRAIPRPRIDILVPAHKEQDGIELTVESLLTQLTPKDRLIVIADNCSDETASIARELGAIAVERHNLDQRGKGFALDFGVRFISDDPPDVVVIVDADCIVDPGTIEQISQLAVFRNRPVQATYLFEQPPHPTPKDVVSMLALIVKNLVRPTGLNRLGMPCLLTGTGMAFPWEIIKDAPLASGNIVEDMKLGLDLAIAGHAPVFCAEAKVISVLPQQENAVKSQRTRWEHGHLQTIKTQVPRLIKSAVQQFRLDLLATAFDLLIPPLSLLVMLWIFASSMTFAGVLLGASFLPFLLMLLTGLLIAVAVCAAWGKYARTVVPAKVLLSVPFYILWKVPLYFAFLVKPQKSWVRTERDTKAKHSPASYKANG